MRVVKRRCALILAVAFILLAPSVCSAQGAGGCNELQGEWNWSTGEVVALKGVATLKDDHTVLYDGKPSGKWECTDDARGAATIHWVTGFVDSITFSGDRISGTSTMPGVSISATRRVPARKGTPAPGPPRGTPPSATPVPTSASPSPAPAPLPTLAGGALAQTLQRCIGFAPGQPWPQKPGPSPTTIQFCRQLPAWASYEQAQHKFEARDHTGAAQLLLGAAQAGNPLAALRIAIMDDQGDGVALDKREAFRWYLAAAEAGEPTAQNEVGSFYEDGAIIRGDWVEAAKWYQQSAQLGWNKGQLGLGRAYEYGNGVPLDLQSAIEWYSRAAAQGNAQAAKFAQYLRDNHGLDASTMSPHEVALYSTYLPGLRTLAHTVQPPAGVVFHNKAERMDYILKGIAGIAWEEYDQFKRVIVPSDDNRPRICAPPNLPRP